MYMYIYIYRSFSLVRFKVKHDDRSHPDCYRPPAEPYPRELRSSEPYWATAGSYPRALRPWAP